MTLPPLQALICFEAVARYMSMKVAAEELGITASAVSQQIGKLEAWVNVRLFMRGPRFLALTPEGLNYLRAIQPAFRQISQATQRLIDDAVQHRVTVNCPAEFAIHWLLPGLATFELRHPAAEVLINTSQRAADLGNEGIDFAVRRHAEDAAEYVLHRLPGDWWLIYDKSTMLQPVCLDFRDWLLTLLAADGARGPEP